MSTAPAPALATGRWWGPARPESSTCSTGRSLGGIGGQQAPLAACLRRRHRRRGRREGTTVYLPCLSGTGRRAGPRRPRRSSTSCGARPSVGGRPSWPPASSGPSARTACSTASTRPPGAVAGHGPSVGAAAPTTSPPRRWEPASSWRPRPSGWSPSPAPSGARRRRDHVHRHVTTARDHDDGADRRPRPRTASDGGRIGHLGSSSPPSSAPWPWSWAIAVARRVAPAARR